jgi:hypothetical protein
VEKKPHAMAALIVLPTCHNGRLDGSTNLLVSTPIGPSHAKEGRETILKSRDVFAMNAAAMKPE